MGRVSKAARDNRVQFDNVGNDISMSKKHPFDPLAPSWSGDQGSGQPTTGRILRIVHRKGHGIIRATDGRELFFHRSNVTAGWFSDLQEGDAVKCEAIADSVNGRAQ
jgi:cold shock CspA family protein